MRVVEVDYANIIGRGIKFPFRIDPSTGRIAIQNSSTKIEAEERIKQSIAQILGTRVGERPGLREFGSYLDDLPFEPNDEEFDSYVEYIVTDAITKWEKRVKIAEVIISRENLDDGLVDIQIKFIILATQEEGNMIYPHFVSM